MKLSGIAHETSELLDAQILLREDIEFTLQKYAGELCYVVEDPIAGQFFRIGIPEYTFITLLDGKTTVGQALHQTSVVLGPNAMSEHDAASVCRWLIESQLAHTEASRAATRIHERVKRVRANKLRSYMNPIMWKIPLLKPEPILRKVQPLLAWMCSFPFLLIWIAVMGVAGQQLATKWNLLTNQSLSVLNRENWLWLIVIWLVLKLVRECAHAVFCKAFGGYVREAGILLLVFAPICFVDVSSSWRFASKWKRIAVSAAGMYAELFIGAIAAIVWANTEVGVTNQIALNVLMLSTVTSLLFNANPLMRFDGYYILIDLIEAPNLYTSAQNYNHYLGRRYLCGIKVDCPFKLDWRGIMIRIYGFLAAVWRIFIFASLTILAATLFHGAGIALAFFGAVVWFATSIFKVGKYVFFGNELERPKLLRTLTSCSCLAGLLFALFALAPWPFSINAPAIVDYQSNGVVRTTAPGFVQSVEVKSGQRVKRGQTLLVLINQELQSEVDELKLELASSKIRDRVLQQAEEIASRQAELATKSAFDTRLKRRAKQLEELKVVAPVDGVIVGRDLDSLVGRYVSEGEELMVVADESSKKLVVSINQRDVKLFTDNREKQLNVIVYGASKREFQQKIESLEPRASLRIPHDQLSAAGGGPLAVRPVEQSDGAGDSETAFSLVAPRLTGRILLQPDESNRLRAGQLGVVKLRVRRGAFGHCLYEAITDWVERKFDAIRQQQLQQQRLAVR